jgi:hypothetical protein
MIEPWVDYPVRDTWVTSLFAAGKVSGPVAREAYLRCVSRAQYNVAQLDMVLRERRKADQARRVLENEVKLRSTTKPWRIHPTIDAWKIQYREFKGRYLFLVLDGPSSTGKTRFSLSMSAPGRALYCDCSMGVPDLRGHSSEAHDCTVLDELSPHFAIQLKKLL